MNKIMMAVLAAAGAVSLGYGALQAEDMVLVDDQMGLSKTSVFDDPSPASFDYPQTDPSASRALPRAWEGAPPQIPHNVDDFLPISADSNQCIRCHDKPAMMGKKKVKGIPTPMPESHYVKADDGKLSRAGSRHVCTQCHAPQAEVGDLVGNTF